MSNIIEDLKSVLRIGPEPFAHAPIREAAPTKAERADARVGIVLSLPMFAAWRPSRADRGAAHGQDWIFNGAMISALQHGRVPAPVSLRGVAIDRLQGAYDWIGLNYYGCYRVKFDATAPQRAFGVHVDAGNI